eukprot:SAG11_NODE_1040_length_6065_cov_2.701307_7_plen_64_part_00
MIAAARRMLPILTSSIFESQLTSPLVKLPLAIRLKDKKMVSKILGEHIEIKGREAAALVGDSR